MAATERLRITSGGQAIFSGSVGIGPVTTFPNGESFLIQNSGVWNVTIGLNNTGTSGRQWNIFSTNTTFSQGAGKLLFYNTTAGSDAMVIDSSNRVGIGTNNPARLLHLEGPTIAYGQIRLLNTSASGEATIHLGRTDQSEEQRWTFGQGPAGIVDNFGFYRNGANRLIITSGGNVLIGTGTDAGYTLNVAGNAQFIKSSTSTAMVVGLSGVTGSIIRFSYNGGFVGSISTDGSNTAYNTSSDYRLKQDIKDFNGLDLLSRIKTYDFEWKSDNTRSYGVLAHELQEVIDYAVHGGKDEEEMQGVDYSKLVPIMVKAIQEQQAQIQELKNKLS
jgi:hypothetical protein